MVDKIYDEKRKVTIFSARSFPALSLTVPDDGTGIFLGNARIDAIVGNEIADTFREAGKRFQDVYKNKGI